MRIGIDIMGGDFAPASIIEGVLLAQKEQKDNLFLVCKELYKLFSTTSSGNKN